MFNKKAQGMSMNIIVVAAVALVILVVLIVIFVGRSGKFVGGIEQCQGQCVPKSECGDSSYERIDYKGSCVNSEGQAIEGQVCCISVVPS